MFRKQVSARAVAIVVVLVLAIVQFTYWRLLVYRPPGRPERAGGGGPIPGGTPGAYGLKDVVVETLAGEVPGYVDGPAWKARFCGPNALALDKDGSLLVTDSRNHRLRRVSLAGVVTTVAGGGLAEGAGGCSEGPALEARFRYPSGVAVGLDGAVFVADTGNHRICRLAEGKVSVLAGGPGSTALKAPGPLAVGTDGAIWVLDAATLQVLRIDPQGGVIAPPQIPADVKAKLGETRAKPPAVKLSAWPDPASEPEPTAYAVGRSSAAWNPPGKPRVFGDVEGGVVLMEAPTGPPLLLAGRFPGADDGMPSDGEGGRASFVVPCATVFAPDGTVYVAEYEAHRIRRLRLPQWLLNGQMTAPGRPGRWRDRRGS